MKSPYKTLAWMTVISFVIMFALSYVMVSSTDHIYLNINHSYMALTMVAPMVLLMLFMMPSMYPNKKFNYVLSAISAVVFVVAFACERAQLGVGKAQFLRSMIPHHSSAIFMCEKSAVSDPEIVKLRHEIVDSQNHEITQMRGLLEHR